MKQPSVKQPSVSVYQPRTRIRRLLAFLLAVLVPLSFSLALLFPIATVYRIFGDAGPRFRALGDAHLRSSDDRSALSGGRHRCRSINQLNELFVAIRASWQSRQEIGELTPRCVSAAEVEHALWSVADNVLRFILDLGPQRNPQ